MGKWKRFKNFVVDHSAWLLQVVPPIGVLIAVKLAFPLLGEGDDRLSWIVSTVFGMMTFLAMQFVYLRRADSMSRENLRQDLIATNAIVPDGQRRLCITAKVYADFPDESEFRRILPEIAGRRSSIDVVRMLAYQDLVLTPQYLNYLFYQHPVGYGSRKRVVVVSGVCQATLIYLLLSMCSGHETYVMGNNRFREFIASNCGKGKPFRAAEFRRLMKGNASMVRVDCPGGSPAYWGKYTDFRDHMRVRRITDQNAADSWRLLESLATAGRKISQRRELYHLDGLKNALQVNARNPLN